MIEIRSCSNCGHVMIESYNWYSRQYCYQCANCGRVEYELYPAIWIRESNNTIDYREDENESDDDT